MVGRVTPPSREDVVGVFDAVLNGELSRERASEWASPWIVPDDVSCVDDAVWKALTQLLGIDLRHGRGLDYLHSRAQILGVAEGSAPVVGVTCGRPDLLPCAAGRERGAWPAACRLGLRECVGAVS
jgi:hypothetical protein